MRNNIIIDKNELSEMVDKYSIQQISEITKCSETKISNYIIKYGLHRPVKSKIRKRTNYNDFINKKISKLYIIKFSEDKKYFYCECECGNKIKIKVSRLRNKPNAVKSCGCAKFVKYNIVPPYVMRNIVKNSTTRNIELSVSLEYIEQLFLRQNKKCVLSGLDISFHSQNKYWLTTASLDRISSLKGYVEGNVQWIHKDINLMKWDHDQNKFIEYCKLIANKFKDQNV